MKTGLVACALRALFFISILFATRVQASSALVLITPEAAGPNVPAAFESHPTYVLWPTPYPAGTENGLLSLLTGLDWKGSPKYLTFQTTGANKWTSAASKDLDEIGYFKARADFLGSTHTHLLAGTGTVSSDTLLLTASSVGQTIQPEKNVSNDRNALVICRAINWDEVAKVSKKCGGRVLVLEYPPSTGSRWSRFWRFGHDWPAEDLTPADPDLNWPGLIPAHSIVSILREPAYAHWQKSTLGPNAWLNRISKTSGSIRTAYLLAIFVALAIGLALVKRERSSPIFRSILLLLLAAPAIDLVACAICTKVGLGAWPFLVPALCFPLLGIFALLDIKEGEQHSLDPKFGIVCLFGTIALTLIPALTSDYSTLLSTAGESFEVDGALVGYTVGLLLWFKNPGWRFVAAILIAVVCILKTNGGEIVFNLVGPAALVSTLPWRWMWSIVFALLPLRRLFHLHGFVQRPYGLLNRLQDLQKIDIQPYLAAATAPSTIMSILSLAVLVFQSNVFARHFLLKRYRETELCRSLGTATIYLLSVSLLSPGTIAAALTVALGGAMTLCYVSLE